MVKFLNYLRWLSIVSGLAVFSISSLYAQLNVGAEFRPRFEYRWGYRKLPSSGSLPAFVTTQRSRLSTAYTSKFLTSRLSFQDVRIWGDEPLKKDVAGLGIYEAWVVLKLHDSISVRAGRQELIYDNERFLSINNWSQKGVTHDALLFKFSSRGWDVHFGSAFNQSRDTLFSTDYYNAQGNYKSLNFLWIKKNFGRYGLQGLGIADAYQKKNTLNTMYLRGTYGCMFNYITKMAGAELRAFYQSGQDETGRFIGAFYFSGDLFYKPVSAVKIAAGCEYFSGQDAADSMETRVTYFTAAYGSNHKFNGSLDYYTKAADTKNAGLINPYLMVSCDITKKISAKADFHAFFLENNYLMKGNIIDKFLGIEGDLLVRYDVSKEVGLQLGYSVFRAGKSQEITGGGNADKIPSWGWIMIVAKPALFSGGK